MTLGNLATFSVPQFLNLRNRDSYSTCFKVLLNLHHKPKFGTRQALSNYKLSMIMTIIMNNLTTTAYPNGYDLPCTGSSSFQSQSSIPVKMFPDCLKILKIFPLAHNVDITTSDYGCDDWCASCARHSTVCFPRMPCFSLPVALGHAITK